MKLYNEEGELQTCRCQNPTSFEPVHGGKEDEDGTPMEYQCLVCGVRREGKFWSE